MEHSIESFNSRLVHTEECVGELEDRLLELSNEEKKNHRKHFKNNTKLIYGISKGIRIYEL
jgi:hypothetical protein